MSRQTSIAAVEAIINYAFHDKEKLWRAICAAGSPLAAFDGPKTLAMLGDAVLRVALMVELHSTGLSRGVINQMIADIVSNQNLADVCTTTGIVRYINGNPSHVGAQQTRTKSATIEAILGAVFLDSGKNIDSVRTVMIALGLNARTG